MSIESFFCEKEMKEMFSKRIKKDFLNKAEVSPLHDNLKQFIVLGNSFVVIV